MEIDSFGGRCLTNTHLAFGPKRFSRRFAPQNDKGYGITTSPLMTITTFGVVMPLNKGRPLINAGKAQDPMDS